VAGLAVRHTGFRQAQPASGLLRHLARLSRPTRWSGRHLCVRGFDGSTGVHHDFLPTRVCRRTARARPAIRRTGFRQAQPTSVFSAPRLASARRTRFRQAQPAYITTPCRLASARRTPCGPARLSPHLVSTGSTGVGSGLPVGSPLPVLPGGPVGLSAYGVSTSSIGVHHLLLTTGLSSAYEVSTSSTGVGSGLFAGSPLPGVRPAVR
jgi:hypothetical protein